MNGELESRLLEKYPQLFSLIKERGPRFGEELFECGDGWFDLIDALCQTLAFEDGMGLGDGPLLAHQVKQKLGTLRFYARPATDHQRGAITMAVHASERICEICGSPGQLRTQRVLATRCDRHAAD